MAARQGVCLLALLGLGLACGLEAPAEDKERRPDRVLFDFESGTFEGLEVTGDAFGKAPTQGEAPGQRQLPVSGYLGSWLANSYVGGDGRKGKLVTEPFEIDRQRLRVLVGGGKLGVGVRLRIGRQSVFEVAGEMSENVTWRVLDLGPWQGKRATLEVFDESDGPWAHVLCDHAVLTDDLLAPFVCAGPFMRIFNPSTGEKRPWYVNDHCFVRAPSGLWHLFGTSHPEPSDPMNEVTFVHATGGELHSPSWKKRDPVLAADPTQEGAREMHIWAPHIIRHGGVWLMFYAAGDPDPTRYRLHLATSRDLDVWERHPGNPILVDGYHARDPFVLEDGGRWLLYTTATSAPEGGHHVVKVRTSTDLMSWSEARIAFRHPARGTHGGPTEAPCVVRRGDAYYLFIGPASGEGPTRVYRSRDPLSFHPADEVGQIPAHGCEVVQDEEGRWYVSHAGWGQGGVWLAQLYWAD